MILTAGPGEEVIVKGIYELNGETLKICFAAPGKPRPTDFTNKPKSGRIVEVLERVKS